MDLVVQVLRNDKPNPVAGGYRGIDIVDVFMLWDGPPLSRPDSRYHPMQKIGNDWVPRVSVGDLWAFITVTGIPDSIDFDRIKDVLNTSYSDWSASKQMTVRGQNNYLDMVGNPSRYPQYRNINGAITNPDGSVTFNVEELVLLKGKCFGRQEGFANPIDCLPNNKKADYQDLGYITISLNQAKSIFFNKGQNRYLSNEDLI